MGNQTTIIIRNDGFGEIKRNAEEFVRNLEQAINQIAAGSGTDGIDISAGNHCNPARVISCIHSDSTAIIASGGATANVLTVLHKWRWSDTGEMLRDVIHGLVSRLTKVENESLVSGKKCICREYYGGNLKIEENCPASVHGQ